MNAKPTLFALGRAQQTRKPNGTIGTKDANRELVSIVIPTLNSSLTLATCLESVRLQSYEPIELIVVDGGSRDDTLAIASRAGAQVHYNPGLGMAAATNVGIQRSAGHFILRLDADVVLHPQTIEQCVTAVVSGGLDAVCVFWAPDPGISFWAEVRRFELDCLRFAASPRGARFFPRSVIDAVGGLNPRLNTGEDYDVYNRLVENGFHVGTIPLQDRHIGEPRTLADVVRKNYHYGMSARSYLDEYHSTGFAQLSPPIVPVLKNWRRVQRRPRILLGYIVYVTAKYSAAAAGMLGSTIMRVKR